jgi:nitronate monooxygenase
LGTAFLFCPEARIADLHRKSLKSVQAEETALTNLFSGRPARGILNRFIRELGPMNGHALDFPVASLLAQPLRQASEANGSVDFMQMWSGQSAALGKEMGAHELVQQLAEHAKALLKK